MLEDFLIEYNYQQRTHITNWRVNSVKKLFAIVLTVVMALGSGQLVSAASKQDQLLNIAKEQLGVPYVFGGTSSQGFDCSGYTHFIFKQLGVDIPRTTIQQSYVGDPVSKKNLQVGDLVFFKNTYRKGISHVGIYVGENNFISATSSRGIDIVSLDNSYWGPKYAGARRVGNFSANELFSDLAESHVAFEAVKTLTDDQVINGYTDGSFRPEQSITRGQAAALLNNYLKLDSSNQKSFPDVADSYRFAKDIAAMKKAGIINGFPDGQFKPEETITRGQMAIIIMNAFHLKPNKDQIVQTSQTSGTAQAVVMLSSIDSTNVFDLNTFNTEHSASRADFSIALYSAIQNGN